VRFLFPYKIKTFRWKGKVDFVVTVEQRLHEKEPDLEVVHFPIALFSFCKALAGVQTW